MIQLYSICALIVLSVLQFGGAVKLRNHTTQSRLDSAQVITARRQAVGTFLGDVDTPSCALPNLVANLLASNKALQQSSKAFQQKTKLRVCNAATTDRAATLIVSLNGKPLHAKPIPQRECKELIMAIQPSNNIKVELSGQVLSEWSTEKSESDMLHMPVLCLVAYIFGRGKSTTFTVNEFHGEDTGLNSVQLAYMDIWRGGQAADLQLISPKGSFQVRGGTYVHICGGEYSIQFVQSVQNHSSKESVSADATLVTTSGEQYVVLRMAPEDGNRQGTLPRPAVMMFPNSGSSRMVDGAYLATWVFMLVAMRTLL